MKEDDKIEITLSKGKLIKGLIASIVFVVLGFWILIYKPTVSNAMFDNPFVKYGSAVACLLFFGFAIFYFSFKLTDKKPGIVVSNNGILDNSSAVAAGLIPWKDIKQFAIAKVMKQEFLIIVINNPEFYINKQTNIFKKKGMQYNLNNYGSPLAISAIGLKCSLNELIEILDKELHDQMNQTQISYEITKTTATNKGFT
jgi:hypothetical protein